MNNIYILFFLLIIILILVICSIIIICYKDSTVKSSTVKGSTVKGGTIKGSTVKGGTIKGGGPTSVVKKVVNPKEIYFKLYPPIDKDDNLLVLSQDEINELKNSKDPYPYQNLQNPFYKDKLVIIYERDNRYYIESEILLDYNCKSKESESILDNTTSIRKYDTIDITDIYGNAFADIEDGDTIDYLDIDGTNSSSPTDILIIRDIYIDTAADTAAGNIIYYGDEKYSKLLEYYKNRNYKDKDTDADPIQGDKFIRSLYVEDIPNAKKMIHINLSKDDNGNNGDNRDNDTLSTSSPIQVEYDILSIDNNLRKEEGIFFIDDTDTQSSIKPPKNPSIKSSKNPSIKDTQSSIKSPKNPSIKSPKNPSIKSYKFAYVQPSNITDQLRLIEMRANSINFTNMADRYQQSIAEIIKLENALKQLEANLIRSNAKKERYNLGLEPISEFENIKNFIDNNINNITGFQLEALHFNLNGTIYKKGDIIPYSETISILDRLPKGYILTAISGNSYFHNG